MNARYSVALAFATLLASSAVFAQVGPGVADRASMRTRGASGGLHAHNALRPLGPNGATPVLRTANQCPPDNAEPVWGANSELLGYSCVTAGAN